MRHRALVSIHFRFRTPDTDVRRGYVRGTDNENREVDTLHAVFSGYRYSACDCFGIADSSSSVSIIVLMIVSLNWRRKPVFLW